jgi:hypothetical protein
VCIEAFTVSRFVDTMGRPRRVARLVAGAASSKFARLPRADNRLV